MLVDTAALPARERPEPWAEAHERIFFPIGVRLTADEPLPGRGSPPPDRPGGRVPGDERRVGDQPQRPRDRRVRSGAVPRRDLAERHEPDRAGRPRDASFCPGELTSWDSSHPFAVTHVDAFDLLLIVVPRALLGPRRDAICAQTAGRLDGTLAGPFFRQVWRSLDAGQPQGEDIADALIALVRALHVRSAPRLPGLLGQVKAFIDAHLDDDHLSPETIARAHFISTRSLHKLFSAEDVTVSAFIRRRRLEACRRDLLDPALGDDPISAIARRHALANPAHFSRAFRAAYGCTPSELRALSVQTE